MLWSELVSLRHIVENDHDHRLRRIEADLKWALTLLGGVFLAIIGAAIAMLTRG